MYFLRWASCYVGNPAVMSETTSPKNFRDAVIASELVTAAQVEESLGSLDSDAIATLTDERLAEQLVFEGFITAWQAEQLKLGRTRFSLGPYNIVDAIGVGGMGQVFKAEHAMMGRIVAVKVLPRSKATPDSIQHFAHEIRAQARLDHPNLVRAYDAGHDGNVYYLVTEYVPGSDLRTLVRRLGRLSQRDAATIIAQVASGLQHVHEMGLVHRDTKPGNVLVTEEGHAKLSDLGLAGFLIGDWGEEDPRAGKIVGTADYLAPEQILTPDNVTASCDIYGLGCTLYYAVTGKVPFPGGTNRDKCHRHCNEAPLNPRRFHADLSPEFITVMADMMDKDPKERIATAAEVVWLLSPWVDEKAFASSDPDDTRWADAVLSRLDPSHSSDTAESVSDLLGDMDGPISMPARSHDSQTTDKIVAARQDTATVERLKSTESTGKLKGMRFTVAQVAVMLGLSVAITALFTTLLIWMLL